MKKADRLKKDHEHVSLEHDPECILPPARQPQMDWMGAASREAH